MELGVVYGYVMVVQASRLFSTMFWTNSLKIEGRQFLLQILVPRKKGEKHENFVAI